MKKFLSLLLIAAMLLGVTACGGVPAEVTVATTETTEAPTEEMTEATEATEAPAFRLPLEVEMPELGPREDVEIPADAGVALSGSDTILTEPVRGSTAGPLDQTRPWYGTGTCTTMTGTPYILYLLVSDNESRWTESDAIYFIDHCLSPGVWWLEDEAARWGVELDFDAGWYCGTGDGFCHYDGILGDFDTGCNPDILEKVAVSMGFADQEEMHRLYREWTGNHDVLFVVVPNKPGRSYAFMDGVNDGYEFIEHCVIFGQNKYVDDGVYPACPATTAHEILHCFGTEDYYIQGTTRRSLAEAYFPNDIMLTIYMDDIRYNTISPYTAYSVGWTDVTPDICYDPNWWS